MRFFLLLFVDFFLLSLVSLYSEIKISEYAASNIKITEAEKETLIEQTLKLDIAEASKQRLIEFLSLALTADYIPPDLSLEGENYEALCAAAVSRVFWFIFGNEDDWNAARGVSGDAWNMARNVVFFGGQAFLWDGRVPPRTGDILGVFYAYSIYNYIRKNRDYTHLALVVGNLPERGPVIAHWWRIPSQFLPKTMLKEPWFFRLECLSDLLEDFPGFFVPKEIIRPKQVFLE
ncbi:MAG: hypothetical protein LBD29_07770 [Treponema sp.]|jgi:hypothetical protein|nr:hypothetical protein [Treponema sp.]